MRGRRLCGRKPRRRRVERNGAYALIYFLLIATTLAVFWQVRRFEFINYDDDKYVTGNVNVTGGLTAQNVVWAFTSGYFLNWHPLTWLSHMLDCRLFGLNAGGHHLVNVLIHLANTLLLFEWLRRMTRARGGRGGRDGRDALWRSALVAAVFAIHPVHVQRVAWIASRKDVLSTFFWFLTILCYHFYAQRPSVRWYMPVVASFALGLMAKSMLVTLPCTLLLFDFWPLGRFNTVGSSGFSLWSGRLKPELRTGRWLKPVIEKIPLFLISLAAGIVASKLMVPGLFPSNRPSESGLRAS